MLVLASTSPRRYQIFSLLNLPFLMVPPEDAEAICASSAPAQEALRQAHRKAVSLVARFPDAVVLGSDTLINLGGGIIGKPVSPDDARAILRRLRGRTHEVVTAVSILREGKTVEAMETARVTMRDFSDDELEAYLATGDSLGKAGAYSIQGMGRGLVADLDGDYLAVMGLPLRAVVRGLTQIGVPVAFDVERLYRERAVFNWGTFEAP